MPLAKKIPYLIVSLLLMCAFTFLMGGKSYLSSGDQTKAAKPADAPGKGETPSNWFDDLGKPKDDGGISGDTIARARQLQEEKLSREISQNPAGKLNNATISDTRLPDMKLANVTINGTRFINCQLPGFAAEKVTFNNVSFHRVTISKAMLTRVTFNNCIFENSNIEDGILTDTEFKRGEFRRVQAQTVRDDIWPGLFRCSFEKVRFDGAAFRKARIHDADGEITFHNIDLSLDSPSSSEYLISGSGLRLRLENSTIKNMHLAHLGENNKLYALKSTFKNAGFVIGARSAAYLDECRLETSTRLTSSGTVVLRDCRVNAYVDANPQSRWFFENCEFEEDFKRGSASNSVTDIRGADPVEINLLGSPKPAHLNIQAGGHIHVQDMTLLNPSLSGSYVNKRILDLLDVTLVAPDFTNMLLNAGAWKNVDLQPRARYSSRTSMEGLAISNVTESKGPAWADGKPPKGYPDRDGVVNLERKKAPTPEELKMP